MKSAITAVMLAVAVLTAVPAPAAGAEDVSGTWTGSVNLKTSDGQSNLLNLRADFKQENTAVTGTLGPSPAQQFPLVSGTLRGRSFTCTVGMPVRKFTFELTLVSADRLEGDVVSDDGKANGAVALTRTVAGRSSDDSAKRTQLLAIVNGTVVDGTGRDPLPDAVVIVRGSTIETVGRRSIVGVPAGAQIIDAGGGTILPGFINAHVHDAYSAKMLEEWAHAGVTTVRDENLIRDGSLTDYLRLRKNWSTLPTLARLVSAGRMLAAPNGYGTLFVKSADEAREAIGNETAAGVDLIKFSIEDGYGTKSDLPLMAPATVAAIVKAAHASGKAVSAHVTEAPYLKQAVEAGVDDLGHIAWDAVDDAVISSIVARDIYVTPTITVFEAYGAGDGAIANLRRFARAGVKLALGNDYTNVPQNNFPHFELGMPMFEIRKMADAGMTPMAIIVASTRNAAHVCRLDKVLGTLEAGKTADVLVLNGDPLRDLGALTAVRAVVHGGVVIRNEAGR